MPAFGSPWGDIDETRPGQPYVVDDSGWGWFFIAILLALPFFIIWTFLGRFAKFVCQHPILCSCIYIAASLLFSCFYNARNMKCHRVVGFLATIISLLPVAWVQGVYAIPYILITEGFFWVAVEWLLVTAAILGVTAFVLSINALIKNGLTHLATALFYCVLIILIVSPPDELTMEAVKQMYGLI